MLKALWRSGWQSTKNSKGHWGQVYCPHPCKRSTRVDGTSTSNAAKRIREKFEKCRGETIDTA